MFQRLSELFITLLSLAATALIFLGYRETSATVMFIVVLVSLAYVLVSRFSLKRFSSNYINIKSSQLTTVLAEAGRKIRSQQQSIHNLIVAVDKIGNNESIEGLQWNVEEGEAIMSLQSKLIGLREKEEQTLWAVQGIAHLAEIRKENAGLEDYGNQVITHLVKFLSANQGAFYIKVDDDREPSLQLLVAYAYGTRKYSAEKINVDFGSGLVGQCASTAEVILMTNVPKDYVKITSGLGQAVPRCVVLLPLLYKSEVFGVIELASFQEATEHQIEFLKKAGETVAVELSGIRSNERTKKLMERSREEELRQNLEEMKAVQREMIAKEEELSQQLVNTKLAMTMADSERRKNEAILEGCMDGVISFNQNGTIEYFNRAAEEMFGISREEIIQKNINLILSVHIVEGNDGELKIISVTGNEVSLRTEVNTLDGKGDDMSFLLTATKVKIDKKHLFTLFAQKVSVELF